MNEILNNILEAFTFFPDSKLTDAPFLGTCWVMSALVLQISRYYVIAEYGQKDDHLTLCRKHINRFNPFNKNKKTNAKSHFANRETNHVMAMPL